MPTIQVEPLSTGVPYMKARSAASFSLSAVGVFATDRSARTLLIQFALHAGRVIEPVISPAP